MQMKRGNARGYPPSDSESRSDALAGVRRASACKRDDANQMARTIMSKMSRKKKDKRVGLFCISFTVYARL